MSNIFELISGWIYTLDEFEKDLGTLMEKLNKISNDDTFQKLNILKQRLIGLRNEKIVKINHSVMELICARHLIIRGYEVDVERLLDGVSCDIFGVKGMGNLIVEIETGFIPPEHALDPLIYSKARIASKITRYSNYSNKFCLGTPPHYIMQLPKSLTKPARKRTETEIVEIKALCDLYYHNPPVSIDEIKNANIHLIYIIDVDNATVQEIEPERYIEKTNAWNIGSNKTFLEKIIPTQ
jgi:hypothetical protein